MTAMIEEQAVDRIRTAFRRYRDDPALFAAKVLRTDPTEQQREFLAAVARPGAKVAVRSGHGTGKTTVLAIVALWFLFTHTNALVPCTAPTAHQLEDVLWRELRRLIGRMNDWWKDQLSVAAERIKLAGSSGMIVARTARPENPDALQGFHADNILFILDEAAGIHDAVFEVARGALSTPDARVVMTGNPTQLTGYFHNAFHGARETWTRLHFSCLDSPLVAPNYAEEIAREYGEDSDMYRIRVLGDFPAQGLLSIIPADRVEAALACRLPLGAVGNAPAVLGVDPAWMGTDRSVVALRRGIWGRIVFCERQVDGVRLASIVATLQDEHGVAATFIDQSGVGASVCDQLRAIGRTYMPIAFGGSPLDPVNFVNRRAEMWWAMREWFLQDVALDPYPDLKEDLIGPEYGYRDSGKIYLEKKEDMRKRGLASPDLGDALALTFAAPVPANEYIARARRRNNDPYSWMEE